MLSFWIVKLNAFGIQSGVKVDLLNVVRTKSTNSNQLRKLINELGSYYLSYNFWYLNTNVGYKIKLFFYF